MSVEEADEHPELVLVAVLVGLARVVDVDPLTKQVLRLLQQTRRVVDLTGLFGQTRGKINFQEKNETFS